MKKYLINFLLILATVLTVGMVQADTLTDQPEAQVEVEASVPETVRVTIVMTGGRFKVGDDTYTNQTTVELPYASDLTVTPISGTITNVSLDFTENTPAYTVRNKVAQVTKIRTDGTVTLAYEPDTSEPQPVSSGTASPTPTPTATKTTGTPLPKLNEKASLALSLLGLVLVIAWVVGKRRSGQEED